MRQTQNQDRRCRAASREGHDHADRPVGEGKGGAGVRPGEDGGGQERQAQRESAGQGHAGVSGLLGLESAGAEWPSSAAASPQHPGRKMRIFPVHFFINHEELLVV
jgi:hypothetical protein